MRDYRRIFNESHSGIYFKKQKKHMLILPSKLNTIKNAPNDKKLRANTINSITTRFLSLLLSSEIIVLTLIVERSQEIISRCPILGDTMWVFRFEQQMFDYSPSFF